MKSDQELSGDPGNHEGAIYKIVRFFSDPRKSRQVIKEGLLYEDARSHCDDPSTSGNGWFDGFTRG